MKYIFIFLIVNQLLFANNDNCTNIWELIQQKAINLNNDFNKFEKIIKESSTFKNTNILNKIETCYFFESNNEKLNKLYFEIQEYQKNIDNINNLLLLIKKQCSKKDQQLAHKKYKDMKQFEIRDVKKLEEKYQICKKNIIGIKKEICENNN